MTARPSLFRRGGALSRSPEFVRIDRLPRRQDTVPPAGLTERLTELLRTDGGTMSLRPIQAQALYELGERGGLFGPIRVGGGKTLLSLLAPYILDAKRPVLLLPASLIEKTQRAMRELSKHWLIPRTIRILSYEGLGRIAAADTLSLWRPDLIVADEAHRLKNRRAGVTRRVVRYMHEHPDTRFVAISGTMMRHSIKEFAHLIRWTHGADGAPVPRTEGEVDEWACALDAKVNPMSRRDPGPLLEWTPEGAEDEDEITRARRGFHRRLVETPAVVSTGGEQVSCSLYVRGLPYTVQAVTQENFRTLRTAWETPDGWAFSEAVELWAKAKELALGFHHVWDPRPPPEWLEARREWAAFVRETLSSSRTLDTELQVANACAAGDLDDHAYIAWREIRDTFKINPKAVWHDDSALDACAAWMRAGPGIVWCDHVFFARELARRTGAPYYGAKGEDSRGNKIPELGESGTGKGVIIASVAANSTGRNLQAWSRNLITSCPSGAPTWEQLLGRTHRDGQEADEVTADVLVGCSEHLDGWLAALEGARNARDTLGDSQKILDADAVFPDFAEVNDGPRYGRNVARSKE